ncbi:hypothetical protein GCM10009854_03970 [Saccharopolyspora halophila]|uniref:DUF6542 domain-containing protein n=1 Tax=Saccharopolyspora halophila TaxID=405551 RepID=A0ABP5SIL4_9PSEU
MTATRASQSASPTGRGTDDFSDRSAFGPYGIPLWGAILAAAAPTAIGAIADILIWGQPGILFKILFFLGSLAAVLTVKRTRVFGPMVQPPLVLGVVVPVLVLISGAGGGGGGGLAGQALAIARPLITSFPIMAGASAVTLGIGLIRVFVTQRAPVTALDPEAIDPEAKTRKQRPVSRKPASAPERGSARKGGAKEPKNPKGSKDPKERKERKERKSAAKERAPESRKSAPEGRKPRGSQPRGEAPRGSGPRGNAQSRGEGRPKPATPPGRTNSGGASKPSGHPRPADQRGAPPPRRGPAPPRQNPGRPRPPEPPPSGPRRPR